MATFAVITAGRVTNVILAETVQDAELATGFTCVEYTADNPVNIGWSYDGKKFIAPEPTEELTQPSK
jgi:hypothetical protein